MIIKYSENEGIKSPKSLLIKIRFPNHRHALIKIRFPNRRHALIKIRFPNRRHAYDASLFKIDELLLELSPAHITDMLERTTANDEELTATNNGDHEATDWKDG